MDRNNMPTRYYAALFADLTRLWGAGMLVSHN